MREWPKLHEEMKHCFGNKIRRMPMILRLTSESQGENFAEDIAIVIGLRNNTISVISAR